MPSELALEVDAPTAPAIYVLYHHILHGPGPVAALRDVARATRTTGLDTDKKIERFIRWYEVASARHALVGKKIADAERTLRCWEGTPGDNRGGDMAKQLQGLVDVLKGNGRHTGVADARKIIIDPGTSASIAQMTQEIREADRVADVADLAAIKGSAAASDAPPRSGEQGR